MITKDFDPYTTKNITFRFDCAKCGKSVDETTGDIPKPNLDTEKDTYTATMNPEPFIIECSNCHAEYTVHLVASIGGGDIYSDDLPDDTEVEINE